MRRPGAPDSLAADFIRRLTASLYPSRPDGRRVMVLTANYDESGTHAGSRVTVMAGFAAPSKLWESFEREWHKILRKHQITYVHAKELFHRQGPYRGWSRKKTRELFCDILYIIQNIDLFASKTILRNEDYKMFYLSDGKQRYERLDSPYALCFRSLACNLTRLYNPHLEESVNFVLESGHKNAGDAVRVHSELRRSAPFRQAVGALSFGDKVGSCALQAADMLAYACYREEMNNEDDHPGEWLSEIEEEIIRAKLAIVEHVISPEDLKIMRKNFLRKNKLDYFNNVRLDGDDETVSVDAYPNYGRLYYDS